MKKMIIVYSDNICPFCYIGAKRIEKLKEEFNFELEWKPFEIHPETPLDSIDLKEFYPSEKLKTMKDYLGNFGSDVDISINNTCLSNSRLSLQAGEFAKIHEMFTVFQQEVFRTYFGEGKDIGKKDVLLEIAEKIDINKEELITYFNSPKAVEKIKKSTQEAIDLGIKGVPTFIIGNEVVVGAQQTDTLRKVILRYMNTD